jgi:hypothetical protein
VGGTKIAPRPLAGLPQGFAVQEDNVMLEYNIPPAPDVWSFVYNLMRVQETLIEEVRARGLKITVAPSMKFTPEQLLHPQAQIAGCEVDYDVWEKKPNPKVELDKEIRGAGGHIHISYLLDDKRPQFPENLTETECLVMACDIAIGTPASLLDRDQDRRRFYGKAGAFRPKSYGLEYRVLSNFWTKDPALMMWVFKQVEQAIYLANRWGADSHRRLSEYKSQVCAAINEQNGVVARGLINNFGIKLPV